LFDRHNTIYNKKSTWTLVPSNTLKMVYTCYKVCQLECENLWLVLVPAFYDPWHVCTSFKIFCCCDAAIPEKIFHCFMSEICNFSFNSAKDAPQEEVLLSINVHHGEISLLKRCGDKIVLQIWTSFLDTKFSHRRSYISEVLSKIVPWMSNFSAYETLV